MMLSKQDEKEGTWATQRKASVHLRTKTNLYSKKDKQKNAQFFFLIVTRKKNGLIELLFQLPQHSCGTKEKKRPKKTLTKKRGNSSGDHLSIFYSF